MPPSSAVRRIADVEPGPSQWQLRPGRLAARANFDVLVTGRRSTRPLERYARLFDDWLKSGNALCGNRLVRLPYIYAAVRKFGSPRLFSRCAPTGDINCHVDSNQSDTICAT